MLKFKSRQNLTALRYLYRFTEILLLNSFTAFWALLRRCFTPNFDVCFKIRKSSCRRHTHTCSKRSEKSLRARILETYCDRRNTVRKIELTGGRIFVLKQYKRPTRLNQFAYTLFRKSKARRAYEYALRLQQLGFETAAPVAYLEISRHGLFHTGIFFRNSSPTRC